MIFELEVRWPGKSGVEYDVAESYKEACDQATELRASGASVKIKRAARGVGGEYEFRRDYA